MFAIVPLSEIGLHPSSLCFIGSMPSDVELSTILLEKMQIPQDSQTQEMALPSSFTEQCTYSLGEFCRVPILNQPIS